MKSSEVYLRAAEMIAPSGSRYQFACETLCAVVGQNWSCVASTPEIDRLAELFKPEGAAFAWLSTDDGNGNCGYDQIERDFRVLALCLMSAIAADEEESQH